MTTPATNSPAPAKPLVVIFAVILFVALCLLTRSWTASILDRHEFRQTQTAISAYWIKEAGFRLDYETPLFGPPWSIPMEFPLYQWLVATTSSLLGASLETSARGVSLFFFLATLPAVYGLCGLIALAPSRRLLVLAVILASPTYLFWSRTFMIETTALCLSTWFLFSLVRAVRANSLSWAAGACAVGIGAALTKVTTFAIFCLPAGGFFLWQWLPLWRKSNPSASSRWRIPVLWGIPVLASLAAGVWWVRYADHLKQANPFSEFLVSSRMTGFNWGTLGQRFSLSFWSGVWTNISELILGEAALAVLIVGLIASPLHRRAALWCAAFFLSGVLLFSNLFYFHDYYYCATVLFLLCGAGAVLAGIWENVRLPLVLRVVLLMLFFFSQLRLHHRAFGFYATQDLKPSPEIASVIREALPPDGVVLIYGWDWNSLVPYYARRRAIMAPGGRELETKTLDQILAQLPPRKIAAMLVYQEKFNAAPAFIKERTARFGLVRSPFATSPDGDLYLPRETFERATQKLHGRKFQNVVLHEAKTSGADEVELKESDLSPLDLSAFNPKPARLLNSFGVSNGSVGNRSVLNTHAPAEIWFTPPAGATRLTAEFGLAEGAYAGEQPLTDGIGVTISEVRPDAPPRILFRRSLDPVRQPADRGIQKIELTAIGPLTGPLLFAMDPGPQDSLVKDWAYWAGIEIR